MFNQMQQAPSLDHNSQLPELAHQWHQTKENIVQLTERLHALEAEMLPLVETKESGQATTKTDGFTITAKTGMKYKLDAVILHAIRDQISPDLMPLKISEVVDPTKLRYLELQEPEIFRTIAPAIVATPAKVGFSVKVSKEEIDSLLGR